ncbi:hypothetical protein R1sor_010464 [Riccia sorocarpa]|uniref:RRM domain-containing protein n=1 Tax=Riccia sorocarpa TaxID=122646 RepID=A0ABD3HY67_9MARC
MEESAEAHFEEPKVSLETILAQLETTTGVLSDICRGIKAVRSEVSDLRSNFHKLAKRLDDQTTELSSKILSVEQTVAQGPKASIPGLDYEKVLTDMDTRLRSYADVARENQLKLMKEQELGHLAQLEAKMQEREREHADREARSKNLRIVGLPEKEGGDILNEVLTLFRDILNVEESNVVQTVCVGKNDRGARTVLVRFESVESKNAVLANRGRLKGRSMWLDPDLTYSQVEERRREVLKVKEAVATGLVAYVREGRAVVTSRRRFLQGAELPENGVDMWRSEVPDDSWSHESEDVGRNQFTEGFMQLVNSGGLTILNGCKVFRHTKEMTYSTSLGESLVDYLLASSDARSRVSQFHLEHFTPESDHRPLWCVISGFQQERKHGRRRTEATLHLDTAARDKYSHSLSLLLQNHNADSDLLVHHITRAASETFVKKKQGRSSWFDQECIDQRRQVVGVTKADRHTAFRNYKNLVKAKKRKFLLENQRILTSELMRNPRSFWARLKTRRASSDLPDADLRSYVEELYFFPDAEGMTPVNGPTYIFSYNEVEREVGRMGTGRAADMTGVTAELIKWGGPMLLRCLTQVLNMTCQQDLPGSWVERRVVPLFKAGS